MNQFMVLFRSVRDIQEFVTLASRQKCGLHVGNDRYQVNATSFMGLFGLNCRKPLMVTADCSQEELAQLLAVFGKFLAE